MDTIFVDGITGQSEMSNVLFVCLHNAGRSQMSRALFENSFSAGNHLARSAGTTPANRIHPEVINAMDEIGIDLRRERPKLLTRELAEWADVVVTMGCGDSCPYIPGKRYVDWQLDDPAGQSIETVRLIRDGIRQRVEDLIADLAGSES